MSWWIGSAGGGLTIDICKSTIEAISTPIPKVAYSILLNLAEPGANQRVRRRSLRVEEAASRMARPANPMLDSAGTGAAVCGGVVVTLPAAKVRVVRLGPVHAAFAQVVS